VMIFFVAKSVVLAMCRPLGGQVLKLNNQSRATKKICSFC
jgi:hypothetical protein